MAKKKYYQRPDGLFETSRTVNGKRIFFRGKTCAEVDRKILAYNAEKKLGRKVPIIADEWFAALDRASGSEVQEFVSGLLMGLSVAEILAGIVIVGKQNARGLSDDSVLPVSEQPQSRTVRRNNDPVFGDFQNCALAVFQNGRQGQNSVK